MRFQDHFAPVLLAVEKAAFVCRALPAPQTMTTGWSEGEFVDQLSDAAFDVVADGADGGGVETGGVVEVSQSS